MKPAQTNPLPDEVKLLMLLCRWPQGTASVDEAREIAARSPDWSRVNALARHHRVLPLVARNLAEAGIRVPAETWEQPDAAVAKNTLEGFRALAELRVLQQALHAAGIAATVLKGVPLSVQTYGDIGIRDVGDIDLLVDGQSVAETERVLTRNGFVRREPAARLTPRRSRSYAMHFKDYTFEPGAPGGFELDLHWRLFRNRWMPGNALATVTEKLTIAEGLEIRVMSTVATVLYLAVLGAVDGWARLKAVADFTALWNGIGAAGRASAVNMAGSIHVRTYLRVALMLAEGWIGALDDFKRAMVLLGTAEGGRAERMVRGARGTMEGGGFLSLDRDGGSFAMKRRELGLHGSLRYKAEIAHRVLLRPRVWDRFDLPDTLFSLYPLLSPIEWALFHMGRQT